MSMAFSKPGGPKVRITEDVYVRDEYGIRRHAFVKGDIVESYVYIAVMKSAGLEPKLADIPTTVVEPEVTPAPEAEPEVEPEAEPVEADEPAESYVSGEVVEKPGVETKALKKPVRKRKARKTIKKKAD